METILIDKGQLNIENILQQENIQANIIKLNHQVNGKLDARAQHLVMQSIRIDSIHKI